MIAVVDYNAGNLSSVKRALDYLGISSMITSLPVEILSADRIIVPGVGHAGSALATLRKQGIDSALREAFENGTPLLGICLGSQIILTRSEEGPTHCLDFIAGVAARFSFSNAAMKVPHMGWNEILLKRTHPLLRHIQPGDEFYFVHSYYPLVDNDEAIFAQTDYGITFTSALGQKNLFATQFHPEKSGEVGLQLLRQFADWDGCVC